MEIDAATMAEDSTTFQVYGHSCFRGGISGGHLNASQEENQKMMLLATLIKRAYKSAEPGSTETLPQEQGAYDAVPLKSIFRDDNKMLQSEELRKEEEEQKYICIFQRNKKCTCPFAPKWVVAVRGTIITNFKDLTNDLKIGFEKLHASNLCKVLEAVIVTLGKKHDWLNVCVAGHSLGAGAGLLVCQRIVSKLRTSLKEVLQLDCHFYNPPSSTAIEQMYFWASHMKKAALKVFPSLAGPLIGEGESGTGSNEPIVPEYPIPHLYLHPHDLISNDFLVYFPKEKLGKRQKVRRFFWGTSSCDNFPPQEKKPSVCERICKSTTGEKTPFECTSPESGRGNISKRERFFTFVLGMMISFHRFPYARIHEANECRASPFEAHSLESWINKEKPLKRSRCATNASAFLSRTAKPHRKVLRR